MVGFGLISFGCKNADADHQGISSGTIEATINGKGWEGAGGTAIKQTINMETGLATMVIITATKFLERNYGNSETIEISIYSEVGADNIAERTYDVSEDEIPSAQFLFTTLVDGNREAFFANSGTVTVSSVSEEKVEGTFEGTLINPDNSDSTMTVEGGRFNMDFQ